MLTMSQINDIRDLSQKGYSISKISSLTGLDRKTVRTFLPGTGTGYPHSSSLQTGILPITQ